MSEIQAQTEAAKPKRAWVDDESFILAWQAAETKEEAADALGMKLGSVVARAASLRKEVPSLKAFPAKLRTVKDKAYWERMEALAASNAPSKDE
jgi:hypothetical protein